MTTKGLESVPSSIEECLPPGRLLLTNTLHRSWWAKKVAGPKYELDEAVYSRFDPAHHAFSVLARDRGRSGNSHLESSETGAPTGRNRGFRIEKATKGRPGWELRDRALQEGANTVRFGLSRQLYSWNTIQARTPEDFQSERHQGTLAENSRLVKVAARFYGAADVGITVLDRRHVYSRDERGMPIVFEDVEAPIVDEDRRVIPDRCRNVVVLAISESEEAIARAPDAIGAAVVGMGYSVMALVAGCLAEFIRSLGHSAIPAGNDTALSVPLAVDAGLGEMSRMGILITPGLGPRVRLAKVITDLPLEPDWPIDFGVREFCVSCMKCARLCPSQSISYAEQPNYEITGEWNNPGHRGWYINAIACLRYWGKIGTGCASCLRTCPYGKRNSFLHRTVLATTSVTTVFNRFFAQADDWFGFGKRRHPDKWWARDPGPFGFD